MLQNWIRRVCFKNWFKGGLILKDDFASNLKNGWQITSLSIFSLSGRDLAPIFGDMSQNWKLPEIKPPLEIAIFDYLTTIMGHAVLPKSSHLLNLQIERRIHTWFVKGSGSKIMVFVKKFTWVQYLCLWYCICLFDYDKVWMLNTDFFSQLLIIEDKKKCYWS